MPYTISAAIADMSSLRVVRIPRRTNVRAFSHESGWGCAFRAALSWRWKLVAEVQKFAVQ